MFEDLEFSNGQNYDRQVKKLEVRNMCVCACVHVCACVCDVACKNLSFLSSD